MGSTSVPGRVKLITGVIIKDTGMLDEIKDILIERFGEIDYESKILDFDKTHYYKKEMGEGLKRAFYSFKNLIMPDEIVAIKLLANKLEEEFLADGTRRTVNIDPGYVTAAKLVLATTKNFQHRIYLTAGIYAEITLKYKKNSFTECEFTYPDYRTPEYIGVFNTIRSLYMQQVQNVLPKKA
ncbi:MAG: DUF4416 family protein [bacterium]